MEDQNQSIMEMFQTMRRDIQQGNEALRRELSSRMDSMQRDVQQVSSRIDSIEQRIDESQLNSTRTLRGTLPEEDELLDESFANFQGGRRHQSRRLSIVNAVVDSKVSFQATIPQFKERLQKLEFANVIQYMKAITIYERTSPIKLVPQQHIETLVLDMIGSRRFNGVNLESFMKMDVEDVWNHLLGLTKPLTQNQFLADFVSTVNIQHAPKLKPISFVSLKNMGEYTDDVLSLCNIAKDSYLKLFQVAKDVVPPCKPIKGRDNISMVSAFKTLVSATIMDLLVQVDSDTSLETATRRDFIAYLEAIEAIAIKTRDRCNSAMPIIEYAENHNRSMGATRRAMQPRIEPTRSFQPRVQLMDARDKSEIDTSQFEVEHLRKTAEDEEDFLFEAYVDDDHVAEEPLVQQEETGMQKMVQDTLQHVTFDSKVFQTRDKVKFGAAKAPVSILSKPDDRKLLCHRMFDTGECKMTDCPYNHSRESMEARARESSKRWLTSNA